MQRGWSGSIRPLCQPNNKTDLASHDSVPIDAVLPSLECSKGVCPQVRDSLRFWNGQQLPGSKSTNPHLPFGCVRELTREKQSGTILNLVGSSRERHVPEWMSEVLPLGVLVPSPIHRRIEVDISWAQHCRTGIAERQASLRQ